MRISQSLAVSAISIAGLLWASAENFKTGIDLNFSGQRGVDYEIEQLYYDRPVFDRKVVYIKPSTGFSASHNDRNVKGTGTILTGDEKDRGTIRYKVDQERRHDLDYNSGDLPPLKGTMTFAEMTYLDGSRVVGATGDNGGNLADLNGGYWTKGVRDSVGDEWHSLLVWDDDSWLPSSAAQEFRASDGAYHLFVVAPKTPCLVWSVESGEGKFYTTPAKNYWTPVIYDQTTYAEGRFSVTIRDINGNDVYYRIGGGNFTKASGSAVTLDEGNFARGRNILEYYYEGNEEFVKTRIVYRDPAHPSLAEAHGNLMWKNEAGWAEVKSRNTIWPYERTANKFRWDNKSHGQSTWRYRDGKRKKPTQAIINAFVAKRHGNRFSQQVLNGTGSSKTYAEFAKEMVLDNQRTMDAVGYEKSWPGQAIPNKEQFYRGYWDVDPILSTAFAYDILIAQYRSDQHPDGITPVQDFFIRDCLASWAWESLQILSGFEDSSSGAGMRGMWGTMRQIGGIVCGMVMPTYSTPYYGTSGFDNVTTTTYPWCPFPDVQVTWKQGLFDEKDTMPEATGYPNLANRFNLERLEGDKSGLINDGNWSDKSGYFDYALCRHSMTILANLSRQLYPDREWPELFKCIEKATLGTMSIDGGPPASRRAMLLCMNQNFPAAAKQNIDWILNSSGKEAIGGQMPTAKVYGVVWFDHDFKTNPPAGQVSNPQFEPLPGSSTGSQEIVISSATPGAQIRYTLDGSNPSRSVGTVYSGPIRLEATTTIRAIAYNGSEIDSDVIAATYMIAEEVVSAPQFDPPGGVFFSRREVAISSGTEDARIYFTLNGSLPDADSTPYEGPIVIEESSILRAIAVKEGSGSSGVIESSYEIGSFISQDGSNGFESSEFDSIPLEQTQRERFTFTVKCTPFGTVNSIIGLTGEEVGAFSDLAAIARFSDVGVIEAWSYGGYQAINTFPYEELSTYELVFKVDVDAGTYDLTAKREGDPAPTLIGKDYTFRSSQTGLTEISHIGAWTKNPGQTEYVFGEIRPQARFGPPPGLRNK